MVNKKYANTQISVLTHQKEFLQKIAKEENYLGMGSYLENLIDDICIMNGLKDEIVQVNGGTFHRKKTGHRTRKE